MRAHSSGHVLKLLHNTLCARIAAAVWRKRRDVICEVRGTWLLYVIPSCKTYPCQHTFSLMQLGNWWSQGQILKSLLGNCAHFFTCQFKLYVTEDKKGSFLLQHPLRSGFNPMSVSEEFVMQTVSLKRFSSKYFGFAPSVSFHQKAPPKLDCKFQWPNAR
jgi:hypothetical protein